MRSAAIVPPWRSTIERDDPQAEPEAAGLRLLPPARETLEDAGMVDPRAAGAFVLDPGGDRVVLGRLRADAHRAALRARTCWRSRSD